MDSLDFYWFYKRLELFLAQSVPRRNRLISIGFTSVWSYFWLGLGHAGRKRLAFGAFSARVAQNA